jgi:hypothetical protein
LDYVNVDALPVDFYIRKYVRERVTGPSGASGDSVRAHNILTPVAPSAEVVGYEAVIPDITGDSVRRNSQIALLLGSRYDLVTIPIYIGIGMRLSADIRALKGGIKLTSLGGIAADAEASSVSGTLTVQTLGITGKAIATALPLPSKLDQTTVENGILALGSSRAAIYGNSGPNGDVVTTPRVVGLYSPVGSDPRLINAIYSELSRAQPVWRHPCDPSKTAPPIPGPAH